MVTAKELTKKAYSLPDISPNKLSVALRAANSGAMNDVFDTERCGNYQWWPKLIETVKPKQIVELGGAMGVCDVVMLNSRYKNFHLYSITLEEGGLEFSYVVDNYPNFTPIVGNDLDVSMFDGVELKNTDIWYFDSLHTEEQLRAELDLYSPFFKKGCVVVFDDIYLNDGMKRVWNDIQNGGWGITDSYSAEDERLHWSGYGVCIV